MSERILQARGLAAAAHMGQTYGPGESYLIHLDAVAALVEGEDAKIVAYLHDVVEDTPVTLDTIWKTFGGLVADCVALLTDEPGKSRAERKAASHLKLAKVGQSRHVALIVKAADRLANVEACVLKNETRLLQTYVKEHAAFRLAVYRPGLCDSLWDRLDAAVERER